jgi:exonuclease VII small subunit
MSPSGGHEPHSPSAASTTLAQPQATCNSGKDRKTVQQVRDEEGDIHNVKEGASYLDSRQLIAPGAPVTLEAMAGMLFHITQMQAIPLQIKNAIHSVTFLLENVDIDSKAAAIASAVSNKVDDRLKAAQQELEDAKLEYAQMMALCDECKQTVMMMQEQIDKSSGALDNIQETVTTVMRQHGL